MNFVKLVFGNKKIILLSNDMFDCVTYKKMATFGQNSLNALLK